MPAPPSKSQRAQNSASMGGGNQRGSGSTGRMGVSSGKMGAGSSQTGAKAPSKTGSGQIGSKGGGASQQRPGAGQNAGRVTAPTLGAAKTTAQQARSTALGKVSQAANRNLGISSGKMGAGSTQAGINRAALRAPNGSYYGPKGGLALNNDARMAAARSLGFAQPSITRTPGDAEMLGRMMMAESGSIRNRFGLPRTDGLQGVADVVRNRVLSNNFPDTVPSVLTQRKQFSPIADGSFARTPANPMATRIAEAVLSGEQPPVVGNALNYANLDTVNNLRGYSSAATRRAFNSMKPDAVIADARNPVTRSHTFGTIGGPSDVSFAGPSTPNAPAFSRPIQMASAAPTAIPRPTPRPVQAPIPRPTPRPNDLFTGNIARNAFDTQRAVGVPRARPLGVGPERFMGVETYVDPASTITRNPYEQRAMDMYSGYGAFNTPRPTAALSRPAYETKPQAQYSGYGVTPFAGVPARPTEQPKLTWADNTREVSPRHWGREEANYLTQIGAMATINRDPYAGAGYAAMQNPDGSGLMMGGDTGRPFVVGRYTPSTGAMDVNVGLSPTQYAATLGHELGHVGSYKLNGGYPMGFAQEEVRQRMVDAGLSPSTFTAQNLDAQGYLANPQLRSGMGMSFTPPLPASMQPKQIYDRVASSEGPIPVRTKDQSRVPAYPGSVPAGTYTAPYDPAPRMSPFGNVGQEYHKHPAPPAPWQYRNETAPAAPHPGTPGSQTATIDDSAPSNWEKLQAAAKQGGQVAAAALQQAAVAQKQIGDAIETYGVEPVQTRVNQMTGQAPASITSAGPGARNPLEVMATAQAMMGGQPAPATPQPSQAELMALVEAMRLKGATPEEIAFVQSLISEQQA